MRHTLEHQLCVWWLCGLLLFYDDFAKAQCNLNLQLQAGACHLAHEPNSYIIGMRLTGAKDILCLSVCVCSLQYAICVDVVLQLQQHLFCIILSHCQPEQHTEPHYTPSPRERKGCWCSTCQRHVMNAARNAVAQKHILNILNICNKGAPDFSKPLEVLLCEQKCKHLQGG